MRFGWRYSVAHSGSLTTFLAPRYVSLGGMLVTQLDGWCGVVNYAVRTGIARLASRPVMDGSEDFHLFSHLPTWAEEAREQVAKNMDDQSTTSMASALLRQAAGLPAKLVGAGRKMLG